jgi:EXLDI family protein
MPAGTACWSSRRLPPSDSKSIADWSAYANRTWEHWDWSTQEYQLDVYETIEALQPHIPAPLLAAVVRKLRGVAPALEILDI